MNRPPDAPETGRLLVVDDNPTNRDLLSRRLRRQGHAVAEAESGRQALDALREQPFDLVLLDIMMPEIDGYEVLRQLKADDRLRHIPVIMISALNELESVVRCIELGAEDYLPKPFNPVLLKARIGACLEKKRLRDAEVRLFAELEQNYERLRKLERLRDDLTQMMVHDLRTPLTALLTGLQTISLLGSLNEKQQALLEIAVRGGQTLVGMINDVLDISKMEAGSLELHMEELAAPAVMETAVQQIAPLVQQKGLTLVRECEESLPRFPGDRDKLQRTLVNLLGNAVKFTPPGGTVTSAACRGPNDRSVRFSVRDTGEGIPLDAIGRIFDKFAQAENRGAATQPSTGLGLTFCKMVVEAHGGCIWVESELGQGSTFLFDLPLWNEPN